MRAPARAAVDAFSGQREHLRRLRRIRSSRAWRAVYPGAVPAVGADAARSCGRTCATRSSCSRRRPTRTQTYHADDATALLERLGRLAARAASSPAGRGRRRDPLPRPAGARRQRRARESGRSRRGPGRCSPPTGSRGCPATRRERFVLATPFTPRGRENLVGYLAGSLDARGRTAAHAAEPAARPAHDRPDPGHAPDPLERRRRAAAPAAQPRVARPRERPASAARSSAPRASCRSATRSSTSSRSS